MVVSDGVLSGLIFDLDGTIADTLPMCIAAFQTAARRHGRCDPDEAAVRALFGSTEEGMFARMLGEPLAAPAMATYLEEYQRLHAQVTGPFEGLPELLDETRRAGVRLGVVSGKGADSLAISLRVLGIAHHFSDVASGSREGLIKTACIRSLLERWSLPPARVAYVGDVPSDVRSARAAEVVAVAAAWSPGTDAAALAREQPDALFETVPAFAAWVKARFSQPGSP